MSGIRWKDASLAQLYCIAYADDMATAANRRAAMQEIMRRKQRRKNHGMVQYRKKAVYPR